MNLKDFPQQVELHDSLLRSINYDEQGRVLKLTVDFCLWMQEGYVEGTQPVTCLVDVEFTGVTYFNGRVKEIKSDTLMLSTWSKGVLVIDAVFDEGFPYDCYKLRIRADSVVVRDLQSGNILYG